MGEPVGEREWRGDWPATDGLLGDIADAVGDNSALLPRGVFGATMVPLGDRGMDEKLSVRRTLGREDMAETEEDTVLEGSAEGERGCADGEPGAIEIEPPRCLAGGGIWSMKTGSASGKHTVLAHSLSISMSSLATTRLSRSAIMTSLEGMTW